MPRSPIAQRVATDMQSASWIREMFEKGRRLMAEHGPDGVSDFSLGNPNASPPPAFFDGLREIAAQPVPAAHRYMPNAGFDEARAAVADYLSREYEVSFDAAGVILTCGAAGACNVVLRGILDPGDEVIVLAPFFPEYRFYIEQAQGKMVVAQTRDDLHLDLAALEAAITERTRAILINTPNNPTGIVYPDGDLAELGRLLARHDSDDRPLYLICDDVYHRLVYDMPRGPVPARHYPRSIVTSSFSKDLSIAGERLGYVAIPTDVPHRPQLLAAMTMLNRTLGFVNAPAIAQRVMTRCIDSLCDIDLYRRNRDKLCAALTAAGYELTIPGGALYVFPKVPGGDDVAFVDTLLQQRILAVPGRGFGRAGHIRLSFAVAPETVDRALDGFAAAAEQAGRGGAGTQS